MDLELLNGREFGEVCNNSALPFNAMLQGTTVWEIATPLSGDPQPLLHLALKEGRLALWYSDGSIAVCRANDGAVAWTRPLSAAARPQIDADGMIVVERPGGYQILDWENALSGRVRLPFMDALSTLVLMATGESELRYCYGQSPTPTGGPGSEFTGPMSVYMRYNPDDGSNPFPWHMRRPGFLLDAFFDAGRRRICMVTSESILVLDADGSGDQDVRSFDFSAAFAACFDTGNNLVAVIRQTIEVNGRERDSTGLTVFDAGGTPLWRYPLPDDPRIAQPPAALADGSVLIMTCAELHKVREGELLWSVPLPCEWNKPRLSILADESVLVAAGRFVLHYSHDGTEVKRIFLEDELTCRPITDSEGHVYVGGANKVYCVR